MEAELAPYRTKWQLNVSWERKHAPCGLTSLRYPFKGYRLSLMPTSQAGLAPRASRKQEVSANPGLP